jgi:hypothetical protein
MVIDTIHRNESKPHEKRDCATMISMLSFIESQCNIYSCYRSDAYCIDADSDAGHPPLSMVFLSNKELSDSITSRETPSLR